MTVSPRWRILEGSETTPPSSGYTQVMKSDALLGPGGADSLAELRQLMLRYKSSVEVFVREHRYHFGTHAKVTRAKVQEYLIVGR
jgi:hypothetical protein